MFADSDEVAQAFRDHVARYSDMMLSPGSGARWRMTGSNDASGFISRHYWMQERRPLCPGGIHYLGANDRGARWVCRRAFYTWLGMIFAPFRVDL
jgi:hypothetical protein